MRTEGFKLWWRDGSGNLINEPVIGWEKDHPIQPTMYFPISPAKPDTSVGDYALSWDDGNTIDYWAVTGGIIRYYYHDGDAAFQASGV